MRLLTHTSAAFVAALLVAGTWVLVPTDAHAQSSPVVMDDDDDDDLSPTTPTTSVMDEEKAQIGVQIRLRRVHIPKGLIELFVDTAPAGAAHTGIGADFVRRKGSFEFNVGFEYESLGIEDGVWIDKGDTIPADEADFLEFDGFGWLTFDAAFVWSTPVHDKVRIRYGAGVGLGIVLGEILRTDYACTSNDVDSCTIRTNPPAENNKTPEDDIPAVFPVINVLAGVQLRPVPNLTINIEGGLRTAPYFGTSIGYFF
jgi:hypothetical protein